MSIELNKLAAEFNRYFTSGNDVDVPARVSVSRDEWRALFTAIQQAEARTDVRCEGCGYMTHHREHMGCVRAAKQFTHPAPGVPEDVVRDAIATVREQYRGTDLGKAAECICDAIDAAMLAAAPAQKGAADA